jgi:peroxiredoxin
VWQKKIQTLQKIALLFTLSIIASQAINGQDTKDVFQKVVSVIDKFENISYYENYSSGNLGVTSKTSLKCVFWKDTTEKGIGVDYCIDYLPTIEHPSHLRSLYDGNVLVNLNYSLNSAEINYVGQYSLNTLRSGAFCSITNILRLIRNTINDNKIVYELINPTDSIDQNYYKFYIYDTTGSSILSWLDKHLVNSYVWIDKNTFLPARYYKTTENGFDSIEFNNIIVNTGNTPKINAIDSIPVDFIKTERYEEQIQLLKKGEYKYWKLPTLLSDTITLTSLEGKIVVIDFWYIGCPSCIQSIPFLNKLTLEFSQNELVIIGINPINKDKKALDDFRNKYDIKYSILLDSGKSISKEYLLQAYPTMYILDKSGKVITGFVGYDKESDDKIIKLIRDNL